MGEAEGERRLAGSPLLSFRHFPLRPIHCWGVLGFIQRCILVPILFCQRLREIRGSTFGAVCRLISHFPNDTYTTNNKSGDTTSEVTLIPQAEAESITARDVTFLFTSKQQNLS